MSNGNQNFDFLKDGGEMGALMRDFDWTGTPLGPPQNWPQSLRVTVRVMLNTRHPMFIWWGPDLIQFYNDAYRETMGPERHPSALGGRGRECWAEIWPIIGPQIEFVMAGKGSTWDEDRLVPVTRHGRKENVWWTYSYGPIDEDGGVGGVLVVCNDVTQQHLTTKALNNQTKRLERLFEQAPSFMAVLHGPDHVFEFANTAFRQLIGNRNFLGRTVREVVPEAEGQGFFELLDKVYTSGEAFVGKRTPLSIQSGTDGARMELFLDFVYQPIVEIDGAVTGIFVEGVDVTEHMRTESHLQLLNGELKHRVKNTLAMVGAIATQTLRGIGNDAALQAFHGRLAAFGKAHDILTGGVSSSASVHDIIDAALEPHRSHDHRFRVSGSPVTVGAKQALSLALAIHELATNATKYGALSTDSGKVDICWERIVKDGCPVFEFTWRESGGPRVEPPTRKGFGTQLIRRVLSVDFGADIDVSFDPKGVVCRLTTGVNSLHGHAPDRPAATPLAPPANPAAPRSD